jgi:membrane-bound metal-dependent hydrolase YbcI (DUF457 family)
MDPLSHAALGRTLAALDGGRRFGPGSTTALVLGSLAPDLDILQAPLGWDVYLRHHQAGTHALVGALVCGAATAAVVRPFCRGARWTGLALAASAGAAGHLLLDWLSGADIQPLWPVWRGATQMPLVAMADPWLVGLFVVALVALWIRPQPRVALAVCAALACVLGARAALYARARTIVRHATVAADSVHADAAFGSWTRWTFVAARSGLVEQWDVDALAGTAARSMRAPRELDDPRVSRSRQLATVANLVASHGVTFARVRPHEGGSYEVVWSDLRYCAPGAIRSEPVCGLWFGGEYDAAGRAVAAIVRIGTFVQRRGT